MSGVQGALLGMGNPLLDISAKADKALLDKYELKNGNQILAEDKHLPLYKELASRPDVQYIAGGATQNTVRVAAWMLREKGACAYVGCVGKDEFADKMREAGEKAGVTLQYMVDDKTATGTCAVCVVDNDRSLVANLAAANNYEVSHLKQPEVSKLLEGAKVVYSAGFFITACAAAVKLAADHCAEHKQVYAVNISAPFICEVPPFKETLQYALGKADYLFGNETEALAFAKSEGWEVSESSPDISAIAKQISEKYANDKNLRVVITQGKEPTLVAQKGAVESFEVPPVSASDIVDTNGAGDAFVGGFLAALIKGKDLSACCKAGNYAASVIIKTSGTACPDTCDYEL